MIHRRSADQNFAATFTLAVTSSLNESPCVGDTFSPWGWERVTKLLYHCHIISVPSSYSGGTSCDLQFRRHRILASSFGDQKNKSSVDRGQPRERGDHDAITPFIRRYYRGRSWQWSGDIGRRRFGLDCILQERAVLAIILVSAKA